MAGPAEPSPVDAVVEPIGMHTRIVGLSDALFAFAATLLAARLVLPVGPTGGDLTEALTSRFPTIGVYAFGFLAIGYQWWRHHRVFLSVKRADTRLIWLNLMLLLGIAVMPYPTALLGESRVTLAVAVFVIPLLFSSLALVAVWEYALRAGLTDEAPDSDVARFIRSQLWLLPAVLVISLALLVVGAVPAMLAWLLLPVGLAVANRRRADPEHDLLPTLAERLRASTKGYVDEGLERLVAYSDAIYAVVLTILAESIGSDEAVAGVSLDNTELWAQVSGQWLAFFAYAITFFTVGTFWILHGQIFGRVLRLRTPLLWLALVHLMVIALQPLGLSMFIDFGGGNSSESTAVYLCLMLVASLTITTISAYADWGNRCVDPATTAADHVQHRLEALSASVIYVLAIVIAVATDDDNSAWAFLAFSLFPLADWMIARRYPESHSITSPLV